MSTNLWEKAPRIWQPIDAKFKVVKSRQQKANVTVIGGLSHGRLFCTLADTTNAESVTYFITRLGEVHNLAGSVIVADNHRAHISA